MADLVPAMTEGIRPHLDRPFAIFGYSLGGMIAYELARRLSDAGQVPAYLLLGAVPAPNHWAVRSERLHELPDDRFLARVLESYGGVSDLLVADADLRGSFVATLRADLEIVETCEYIETKPLASPIAVYAGEDDQAAPPKAMEAWRTHTRGPFSSRVFTGGHFFLNTARHALIADVAEKLAAVMTSRGPE